MIRQPGPILIPLATAVLLAAGSRMSLAAPLAARTPQVVKQGLFEENVLENNGRFGISIGLKDTDNLLRGNLAQANRQDGIFFRNESQGMAGHRNRLEDNLIENNGIEQTAAGIRVRGETHDLLIKNNTIRDTRQGRDRNQTVGIRLEEKVGPITLESNRFDVATNIEDLRKSK